MIYIRELDNYKVQYLNKAFSAPKIWTVDAGYFAKFVKLPACDIRRAPTYAQCNTIIKGANTRLCYNHQYSYADAVYTKENGFSRVHRSRQ